jgi:hypothetical protein
MTLTRHAEQRLRQRGLTDREVQLALTRGTPELSHGKVRVHWRDITVVCVPEDWGIEIITAYRRAH